jgi:hypothetical protein
LSHDEWASSLLQSLITAVVSERSPPELPARYNPDSKRRRHLISEDDDSTTANEGELEGDFLDDITEDEYCSPTKRSKLGTRFDSARLHIASAPTSAPNSCEVLVSSIPTMQTHLMVETPRDPASMARRGHLPDRAVRHLKGWFFSHKSHPYPTEEEKNMAMEQTGLSRGQINNWFTNARRRLLPRLRETK